MVRRLLIAAVVSTAMLILLLTGPVFAHEGGNGGDERFGFGYRPGNGHGDRNHEHTGPPGQEKRHGDDVDEADEPEDDEAEGLEAEDDEAEDDESEDDEADEDRRGSNRGGR